MPTSLQGADCSVLQGRGVADGEGTWRKRPRGWDLPCQLDLSTLDTQGPPCGVRPPGHVGIRGLVLSIEGRREQSGLAGLGLREGLPGSPLSLASLGADISRGTDRLLHHQKPAKAISPPSGSMSCKAHGHCLTFLSLKPKQGGMRRVSLGDKKSQVSPTWVA